MGNATGLELPPGFRLERGLVWPDEDIKCARVIFDMQRDLEHVWPFVKRWDSCIQAGGNCGVWPLALAKRFGVVYTAEPHPMNFTALTINTSNLSNIVRLQAAFGYYRGMIGMGLDKNEQNNFGAFFVEGGGHIPVLRIDDLQVNRCGLIYLDIEGFEQEALRGAANTIARCQPVIVIEDKGLSERYGTKKGDCEKFMDMAFQYKVVDRINRDVIMIPR